MGAVPVQILRVIIWFSLAGSLAVQLGIVPLLSWEMNDSGAPLAAIVTVAGLVVLGVLGLQVIGVSILRLLTLVRHGRVFSPTAFRHVDRIIGAVAGEALVLFGVAVLGAVVNRTTPGDELAPGLIGMICGASLVMAGVALVIFVQRQLLVQATETLARAEGLQSELDEVI
ncbi:ABC transporter [Brachybacterium vulturis]|uniref:ABC transporter n=1 Tax=Brachybacterium vulturis TaxID=2017484 RepID=A0A291GRM5_9MICO|nr:DUF2975 domain-containing protein [Brachybacterium vulturis]ATG52847.1 ABC transporter [Brachybacterium vulturis]